MDSCSVLRKPPDQAKAEEEKMASEQDRNKELAIRFFGEGITNQNFDVITEVLSPMYAYNGDPSSVADNKAWAIGLH
jgi:hypothetical protein